MIGMATRVMLVVWALLSGACSLRAVNTGTLVASTAALACDWGQTRGMASEGWTRMRESNPMLGATPSTSTVDLYFLGWAAATAVAWAVAPEKYKWIPATLVTAVQVDAVSSNYQMIGALDGKSGVCGM